jgi:hypothetical protein
MGVHSGWNLVRTAGHLDYLSASRKPTGQFQHDFKYWFSAFISHNDNRDSRNRNLRGAYASGSFGR